MTGAEPTGSFNFDKAPEPNVERVSNVVGVTVRLIELFLRHRAPLPLALLCAWQVSLALAQTSTSLRSVRVVDAETRQPLADAEVTLLPAGQRRQTAASGVVIVAVEHATNRLAIRRLGYRSAEFTADALRSDSTTTIALEPLAVGLPEVTARRRPIPGTYYRKLDVNGFYERMFSTAAPTRAFVTDSEIAKWNPHLLTDIGRRIGRDLTRCTFVVDGVRLRSVGGQRTLRQGVDGMVLPGEVAGVEVYRQAELPVQFAALGSGVSCIALVWLK